MKKLVHQLADTTCSVLLIPDVFTFNILHSRIEEMNGVPVVPLYDTPLSGVNRLIKRAEDIVLPAAKVANLAVHQRHNRLLLRVRHLTVFQTVALFRNDKRHRHLPFPA
ncbi:hypothetical protein AAIH20_35505, partial [Pseudomonas aeruginosa]